MSLKRTTTEQGNAPWKKAHLVCGCPNSDQPDAANRSPWSAFPFRLGNPILGENLGWLQRSEKIKSGNERERHRERRVVQLGITLVAQRLGVRRHVRSGFGKQAAGHGRAAIQTVDRRSGVGLRWGWASNRTSKRGWLCVTDLREDDAAKQSNDEYELCHHRQCSQGRGHGLSP